MDRPSSSKSIIQPKQTPPPPPQPSNENDPPPSDDDNPRDKALKNSLILRRLLSFFSTRELLNFRFICRGWCDTISSILLNREDLCLSFENVNFNLSLENLIKLIRQSKVNRFPVGHFTFIQGFLTDRHFQDFLSIHGQKIRGLSVGMTLMDDDEDAYSYRRTGYHDDNCVWQEPEELPPKAGPKQLGSFRKLLTEQVPNLCQLSLPSDLPERKVKSQPILFPRIPLKSKEPQDSFRLPNLKILKRSWIGKEDLPFITELLNVAVNLREVKMGDHLVNLQSIESLQRPDLIKEFHFSLDKPNVLELAAKMGLRLEKIRVEIPKLTANEETRSLTSLSQILQSSIDTLEEFTIENPAEYGLIPGLEFPGISSGGLKKVTKLIMIIPSSKDKGWPRRVDEEMAKGSVLIKDVFPKLHTLQLRGKKRTRRNVRKGSIDDTLFSKHEKNVVPSVKRLEILNCSISRTFGPETPLDQLNKVFPNVQSITVTRIKNLSYFGAGLWNFKELRSLELELYVDGREKESNLFYPSVFTNKNSFPELDAVFCGLGHENVENLWKIIESENSSGYECDEEFNKCDQIRKTSILDCKKLTNLHISFYDFVDDCRFRRLSQFKLLTGVTRDYAFRRMPGLCVTVSARPNPRNYIPKRNNWGSGPNSDSHNSDECYYPTDMDLYDNEDGYEVAHKPARKHHPKPADYQFDRPAYEKKLQDSLLPLAELKTVKIVEPKFHGLTFTTKSRWGL